MAAPNPGRQKKALAAVDALMGDAMHVWIIHYSCESFYDRPEGRSPRITSLALRNLETGQTVSFSIHQVAERTGIPFGEIENKYDELERRMLDEYFAHIAAHKGMKYVHWNMRDINYGFAAIDHRYKVLGGDPLVIDDEKKYDLARLLVEIYGTTYVGHPRLESIMKLNNVGSPFFLNGAAEAKAFEEKNLVALHQSTLSKVDIIPNLLTRVHDRRLRTNATWWEMRGGRLRSVAIWLIEHPLMIGLGAIGTIIALAQFVWPDFNIVHLLGWDSEAAKQISDQ